MRCLDKMNSIFPPKMLIEKNPSQYFRSRSNRTHIFGRRVQITSLTVTRYLSARASVINWPPPTSYQEIINNASHEAIRKVGPAFLCVGRRYCPFCRCFVCARPPSLCLDWPSHATAVSTSVVSQQKRALVARRAKQSYEPLYEESLDACAWYYDLGSSRGTSISGKNARGRVRLRLGDIISVGHTELLFCVQPPGWAAPLRAEMLTSSDESSDNDNVPRRASILKDIMKGTLAGISKQRELGVDTDATDAETNKPTSDAVTAVTDKADRLRRLSSLSSKRQATSTKTKSLKNQAVCTVSPQVVTQDRSQNRIKKTQLPPHENTGNVGS